MEILVLVAILSSVGFVIIVYKQEKAEQRQKYEALDAEHVDNNELYNLVKMPAISGGRGTPRVRSEAYLYYEENPEIEATHVLDAGKKYSWEAKPLITPPIPSETLQSPDELEKQIDDNGV